MENATEALLMAGAVLLLIIALTVNITSFTSLKKQVDEIVEQEEAINLATDENGDYINYIENADDIREVGVETILTSIRRMEREDYTIYIKYDNLVDAIKSADEKKIAEKTKESLITKLSDTQKYKDEDLIEADKEIVKISISEITNDLIELVQGVIGEHKFNEYIGIYQEKTNEGVLEDDIKTYRVITYVYVEGT